CLMTRVAGWHGIPKPLSALPGGHVRGTDAAARQAQPHLARSRLRRSDIDDVEAAWCSEDCGSGTAVHPRRPDTSVVRRNRSTGRADEKTARPPTGRQPDAEGPSRVPGGQGGAAERWRTCVSSTRGRATNFGRV